jgi:hypothetical protein
MIEGMVLHAGEKTVKSRLYTSSKELMNRPVHDLLRMREKGSTSICMYT